MFDDQNRTLAKSLGHFHSETGSNLINWWTIWTLLISDYWYKAFKLKKCESCYEYVCGSCRVQPEHEDQKWVGFKIGTTSEKMLPVFEVISRSGVSEK